MQGNPGRRRTRIVADAGTALTSAPVQLKGFARSAWDKLAPELLAANFLKEQDAFTFARYCQHLADFRALSEKIAKVGFTYVTESKHGTMNRLNPDFIARDRIEGRMIELEDRFGLNLRHRQLILQSMALMVPVSAGPLFGERDADQAPADSPIGFLSDEARPPRVN